MESYENKIYRIKNTIDDICDDIELMKRVNVFTNIYNRLMKKVLIT